METVGTVAHKGLQKTTLLLITMHELSSTVKEIDLLWLEVPIKIGTLVSNYFFFSFYYQGCNKACIKYVFLLNGICI